MDSSREIPLWVALLPILLLICLLAFSIYIFKDSSLDGANQIALILASAVAAVIAFYYGFSWDAIQEGVVRSISSAMGAMLILLLIGSLSGTWLISGIVPVMIYYGLEILSPSFFLIAACVACAMTSIATGSSWTTSATIGIALIGVGKALGVPEGMAAGAIISGAYFGDKMSPLSDTTNLAPAVTGTDLFTHIRYMTFTTVPSISIAMVIFLFLGFGIDGTVLSSDVTEMQRAIAARFNVTGWLFLVPLAVVIMVIKRIPALPAIFVGALLGAVAALIFQPEIVASVAVNAGLTGPNNALASLMIAFFGDVKVVTEHELANELLSSGGMKGMLKTVWLILSAMIFGGVMEVTGMLQRIADAIMSLAHSTASLVASTVATCCFTNIAAPDQYLSIAVPGRMYAKIYRDRGLAPQNLSRTLEDSATVTSVLIPWNTCGAFHAGVLGVATLTYLPYCFFNIISPFMTMFFAYFAIRIVRLTLQEKSALKDRHLQSTA